MPIEVPARYARLDEHRLHVLCGSGQEGSYVCGREIGRICELDLPPAALAGRAHVVLVPEPAYPREPTVALRAFRLPPGWERRLDGSWDRRVEREPDPSHDQYDDIRSWWRRVTRLPAWALRAARLDRPPPVLELPAGVVCPRCRNVSQLTAERLAVSAPLPAVSVELSR